MTSSLGHIAKLEGNLNIWYETFGKKTDPPFLLLMGGCCQGILWPTKFCQKLASHNFFVIRFDYRDAGDSTCFDFDETPYTFRDIAEDAIKLLNYLSVKKAHLLGLSTGGAIAQVMAAHYPEKVHTIALMATSYEFRPMDLALQKLPAEECPLSYPQKHYLESMDHFINSPPETFEEKLDQRVIIWNLLNGNKQPLNQELNREMHSCFLERLKYEPGLENHLKANYLSEKLLRECPDKITVPTVIFHGTEDPIFGPDHGEALQRKIKGSKYYLVDGMGHVPNEHFFDFIIEKMVQNTK